MRPTKPSRSFPVACALAAATFLVHSAAQAAVFKATPCSAPALREAILLEVNAVRARGHRCGSDKFGAARPITWNSQLVTAAAGHSSDMAEHDYFDHQNLRGQRPAHRVDAAGYKWRGVAENIAAGSFTARTVMQGWMDSPGHCRNIMDPGYEEIGVACMKKAGSYYGEYWTMVLARRR